MNRRSIVALVIGLVFSASAAYWFTIGRRPLVDPAEAEPELEPEPAP